MEASRPVRGLIRQSRWLLRIASLIVPGEQRNAWYATRCAEVWHWAHFLYESGRLNRTAKFELTGHVWSAFSDAAWKRFDRARVKKLVHEVPRTPRFCLLALAGMLLIAVVVSGFTPTIRSTLTALPYRDPQHLASFSFSGNSFIRYQTDSVFLTASRWSAQSKTAEAVSAYSWEWTQVAASSGGSQPVISARVSPDFFDVLGVGAGWGRVFHLGDEKQCSQCVVLSNQLWRHGFHGDSSIVGKEIAFGTEKFTVLGVLPDSFWFITPEISAWTVNSSQQRTSNFAGQLGAVLRLRPGISVKQAADEFSQILSQGGAGNANGVEVTSIRSRVRQGAEIYLLFTFLAFLGSLALLAYRLISASGPKVRLKSIDHYRWWLFFAAKTVLLLALCFVVSLEGTRRAVAIFTGTVPPLTGLLCIWLFLVATILALTWSLHDQCLRCRECLKRLGHETYVGAPASLLLNWWGTELVCSQGHGMLHVPEMRASWLEMEQWTPLDESWKPLFDEEETTSSAQ